MLIKPGTNADNILTARLVREHQEQCDIQTVSGGEIEKTGQIVPDGRTKSLLSLSLEASRGTVGRQGLRVGDRGGSRGAVLVLDGLLVGRGGLLVGLHWGLVGGAVGVGGLVGLSGSSVGSLVSGLGSEEKVGEDGG